MSRKTLQARTIGSVAKEAGVCVETIRYYHRIGLLPVPVCPPGRAVRSYGEDTLKQLYFIKRAQGLGFSLEEIGSLVALSEGQHCAKVQTLAREKLGALEEKMAEIRTMRDAILALLADCAKSRGENQCPFIEALGRAAAIHGRVTQNEEIH